jgi:hypothetical protein
MMLNGLLIHLFCYFVQYVSRKMETVDSPSDISSKLDMDGKDICFTSSPGGEGGAFDAIAGL